MEIPRRLSAIIGTSCFAFSKGSANVLIPTVNRWFSLFSQNMGAVDDQILKNYNQLQVKLMDEECILVNENDIAIGVASKKVCHLWSNIQSGMLHRAFSVFLFNTNGQLLLQQRAMSKITYPGHWTNTCCSHPLNVEVELDENNAQGVLRAAQRKLKHELGIEPEQIPLDTMKYLTRIHYKSPNVPNDGIWGEHEIDYIIFVQQDVVLQPNSNEVQNVRYVTKDEVKDLVDDSRKKDVLVTPWFKLIVDNFLPAWWNKLQDLHSCMDHVKIHRM